MMHPDARVRMKTTTRWRQTGHKQKSDEFVLLCFWPTGFSQDRRVTVWLHGAGGGPSLGPHPADVCTWCHLAALDDLRLLWRRLTADVTETQGGDTVRASQQFCSLNQAGVSLLGFFSVSSSVIRQHIKCSRSVWHRETTRTFLTMLLITYRSPTSWNTSQLSIKIQWQLIWCLNLTDWWKSPDQQSWMFWNRNHIDGGIMLTGWTQGWQLTHLFAQTNKYLIKVTLCVFVFTSRWGHRSVLLNWC